MFAPCAVLAQQSGRLARIGDLTVTGPTGPTALPPANWDAFVQGLRESGYVEGRNFVFERRFADGKLERFNELAEELVRAKVDIIFARGTAAIAAAKKATSSIPIVGVDLASDPVAAGFVKTLARPGGNITGVFLDLGVLSGKQLELLQELVGKSSRVAAAPRRPCRLPR